MNAITKRFEDSKESIDKLELEIEELKKQVETAPASKKVELFLKLKRAQKQLELLIEFHRCLTYVRITLLRLINYLEKLNMTGDLEITSNTSDFYLFLQTFAPVRKGLTWIDSLSSYQFKYMGSGTHETAEKTCGTMEEGWEVPYIPRVVMERVFRSPFSRLLIWKQRFDKKSPSIIRAAWGYSNWQSVANLSQSNAEGRQVGRLKIDKLNEAPILCMQRP